MPAAYAESPVDRPVNTSRLDDIFARHGVNGTLVIYDVQKNGYWLHNAGRAAERFYPASTFKIFNSLIGLSEGVIKDADEVFYRYSGEPVYLESWKADASLRSAIKLSQGNLVISYRQLRTISSPKVTPAPWAIPFASSSTRGICCRITGS